MIKYIKGDLIGQVNDFDVIIHGCNCFNTMGAGIASQIKREYPEASEQDLNTKKGDIKKLGTYSVYAYPDFKIINLYTQYSYGSLEFNMNLEETQELREYAIKKGFETLYLDFGNKNLKFVFPLIGAGLANGNWDNISKKIDTAMPNEDLTCIIYEKDFINLEKYKHLIYGH